MSNFKIGNIVKKENGSIIIITKVKSETTDWIAFDSNNVSGTTNNKTYTKEDLCWTCDVNDGGKSDSCCETCNGTGTYLKTFNGLDKAVLIGNNVKEYILKSVLKNFDF